MREGRKQKKYDVVKLNTFKKASEEGRLTQLKHVALKDEEAKQWMPLNF